MSNVGKQVRVYGEHVGKIIAETFIDDPYYENDYLVLLNPNGIEIYGGWNCINYDQHRTKLCGKYGKNSNNFFYFFSKTKKIDLNFLEAKL